MKASGGLCDECEYSNRTRLTAGSLRLRITKMCVLVLHLVLHTRVRTVVTY